MTRPLAPAAPPADDPAEAATAAVVDGRAERRLVQLNIRLQDEIKRRRHLERQLLTIAENEQRRISIELHDGLGQQLSGLAYSARSLAQRLAEENSPHATEASWIARLLRDAVGSTRALSRGLWPVSLERESLPQAVRTLAADFERMYGVSFTVQEGEGVQIASSVMAHHLFRIVQEAATNAVRHGHARRIEVRLEHLAPRHMLTVVSDGRDMNPQAARKGPGLGLVSMQLRADALGAELSIEPLPGGGVEVCVLWETGARPAPAAGAPPGNEP